MTPIHIRQDRLCILHVGARRLAVPLVDVAYFARASEQQSLQDGHRWMAGVLALRGTSTWLPVVDLALLWDDPLLSGSWGQIVATHAGIAVGADRYTTTREAVPILNLRPAPGIAALRRAVLLDGQPIPVLDVYRLITPEQWVAVTATA